MENNKIGIGIIVALIVILGTVVLINLTFNYTILALLITIAIVLTIYIYNELSGIKFNRIGQIIIALEVLAISAALNNYFFAKEDIYTNSDYHAIRVDGITINSPIGYQLFGNSHDAFFDNNISSGALIIKACDSLNVTLASQNFTQAIYLDKYNTDYQHVSGEILNKDELIKVLPSDTIRFIGENSICDLYLDYKIVNKECFVSKLIRKILKKENKSICNYIARYNNRIDTLSYKSIIQKGYNLNGILGEVNNDLNFRGINLLRDTYYLNFPDSLDNAGEYYSKQPLYIEINNDINNVAKEQKIKKIIVYNKERKKEYSLNAQTTKDYIIPIGQAFSVGLLSREKTPPARFEFDGSNLVLKYATPLYHNLVSLNTIGANNIYIATSTRQIIDNKNIPENIMLFDIFYNEDNTNNIKEPILLSYVSGPTTQDLEFNIGDTKIQDNQNFKNFGMTQSQSQKISWDITIENFKKTSPFIKENNIIIFIVFLGLLLILCINFGGSINNLRYHTLIEQVSYMCLLLLFSFRLLLLWRASVFPPAEIASTYELKHFFRSEGAILWQFIGLNACIGIILSIKIYLSSWNNKKLLFYLAQLCILSLALSTSEIILFNISSTLNFLILFLAPMGLVIASMLINILIKFFKLIIHSNAFNSIKLKFNIGSTNFNLYNLWNRYLKSHFLIRILVLLTYFILVLSCCYISKSLGFLKILAPVILYIVSEFVIWRYWPVNENGFYQEKPQNKVRSFSYTDLLSSGLLLSLYNGLFFTIGFFLNDGGYGIMFFSFYILMSIIKIYDIIRSYKYYNDDEYNRNIPLKNILRIILLAFLCAVFFRYYKDILAFIAISNPIISAAAISLSILVIYYILRTIFRSHDKSLSASKIIITICITIIISVIGTIILKEFAIRDHIEQRILVHVLKPEQGLSQTKNAEEERRFFEASVNDYILNVYNQQGQEIRPIGEYGKAYFKIRNHSKVGALLGAQSSDILPARFIIAEHGSLLPFFLILIFLIMLYIGVATKTRYRASKMLLIQIPALLFIHSLFVWLANTQMFIFLGQDFPLLSFHSKLAILYFFVLIAIWVSITIFEKGIYIRDVLANENIKNTTLVYYNGFVGWSFVIYFVIMLAWYYAGISPEKRLNYNEDKLYTLKKVLEETSQDINKLNISLAEFQKENNTKVINIHDVSNIISTFNTEYDDYIQTTLGGKDSYKYRVWERFAVKGGAKNNESSALIHARNKRIYKIGKDGEPLIRNNKPVMIDLLQIAVRTDYFDESLTAINNDWKGNIVACKEVNIEMSSITRNIDYTQYCIPKEWTNSQSNIYIIKSRKRETLISNDSREHSNFQASANDYSSSFRRVKADRLNNNDNLAISPSETYFARNVVINGKRTFIYPLSHKFFWAYSLAKEIAMQKNTQKGELPDFHNDIPITIDPELTVRVYDMIETNDYMTVVVADGNGKVRLMVDKKPNYTINPNDSKTIARIGDELYMTFDAQKYDAYFGNLNLINMKDGPGSSQKPIVWTSVASAIDYNWKDLNMYQIQRLSTNNRIDYNLDITTDNGISYFSIDQFNGQFLYPAGKKKFKALFSDENRGNGVSLRDYISHSSNFYNALMLYIGSYKRDGIDMNIASINDETSKSVFRRLRSVNNLSREEYQSIFPILHHGNKYYRLNLPISTDYKESIIFERLSSLFGFKTYDNERGFRSLFSDNIMSPDKMISPYSYVQTPTFEYQIDQNSFNLSFMREAIHQGAVGGPGVWQVSPIFMAQTFGRITMLNSSYNLTIDPNQTSVYSLYDDLSNGYLEARKDFLIGMNNVFTDGGTARMIGNGNVSLNGYKLETLDGYYIYGKTGTTNEGVQTLYSGRTSRVHRLGVVITDKNIENTPISELKNVKFYTVFFTSRIPSTAQYQKILREIIKSESFKKYMNSNNFEER